MVSGERPVVCRVVSGGVCGGRAPRRVPASGVRRRAPTADGATAESLGPAAAGASSSCTSITLCRLTCQGVVKHDACGTGGGALRCTHLRCDVALTAQRSANTPSTITALRLRTNHNPGQSGLCDRPTRNCAQISIRNCARPTRGQLRCALIC